MYLFGLFASLLSGCSILPFTQVAEDWQPPPETETTCEAVELNDIVYDCTVFDTCREPEFAYRLACCGCDEGFCQARPPDNCWPQCAGIEPLSMQVCLMSDGVVELADTVIDATVVGVGAALPPLADPVAQYGYRCDKADQSRPSDKHVQLVDTEGRQWRLSWFVEGPSDDSSLDAFDVGQPVTVSWAVVAGPGWGAGLTELWADDENGATLLATSNSTSGGAEQRGYSLDIDSDTWCYRDDDALFEGAVTYEGDSAALVVGAPVTLGTDRELTFLLVWSGMPAVFYWDSYGSTRWMAWR